MPYRQLAKLAVERNVDHRMLSHRELRTLIGEFDGAGGEGGGEGLGELNPRGQGPLCERYRPGRLGELWGQVEVVRVLKAFVANPHPAAFLFEGDTGAGKTSAALALAAELGCEVAQQEFGGVHVIASGEQSSDGVRQACDRLWLTPMMGSGWKVLIVNEADRMGTPAETIWLDRLEAIPKRSVIVFTTNYAGKLAARFRDRCTRIRFKSAVGEVGVAAEAMIAALWARETGQEASRATIAAILGETIEAGQVSFRRLLKAVERAIGALRTRLAHDAKREAP